MLILQCLKKLIYNYVFENANIDARNVFSSQNSSNHKLFKLIQILMKKLAELYDNTFSTPNLSRGAKNSEQVYRKAR